MCLEDKFTTDDIDELINYVKEYDEIRTQMPVIKRQLNIIAMAISNIKREIYKSDVIHMDKLEIRLKFGNFDYRIDALTSIRKMLLDELNELETRKNELKEIINKWRKQ